MSIEAMKQALKVFETGDYIGGTEEKLRQAIEQAEQCEWVGLTDEEVTDLWAGVSDHNNEEMSIWELGHAIEAKLKEKNHG